MKLREDQQRLKDLLKDTITLLCKNGLQYKDEFSVEALIGITLDQDNVFLVNIKETIQTASKNGEEGDSDTNESSEQAPSPKSARKRPHGSTVHSSHITPSKQQRLQTNVQNQGSFTSSPQPVYNIKTEITEDNDDAELVFVKEEQNTFHSGHSSGGPASVPYPVSFGSSVVNIAGPQGPGDPTGGGIGTANLVNTSLDSSTYLQQSPNMWSMGGQKAGGNQQALKKPYSCPICYEQYSSGYQLQYHLRGKHSIGDPIECSCGLQFGSPQALSKHRKITLHGKAKKKLSSTGTSVLNVTKDNVTNDATQALVGKLAIETNKTLELKMGEIVDQKTNYSSLYLSEKVEIEVSSISPPKETDNPDKCSQI